MDGTLDADLSPVHSNRARLQGMSWKAGLTLSISILAALLIAVTAFAGSPVVDPTVPAARDADAVVLTGKDFPGWAAASNVTAKLPLTDLTGDPVTNEPAPGDGCTTFDAQCAHNHYAKPDFDSQDVAPQKGVPTERLLGYRWNPKAGKTGKFEQIPFQVDEVFTRYLDNSASGFSVYSGQDQHTSYAFDREGWRMYGEDPSNPCKAVPADGVKTTHDPVQGLDTNDELAFMASDAGPRAPSGAALPKGVIDAREVHVADPTNPSGVKAVYVMEAGAKGPDPEYDASNGYVRYLRDPNADTYIFSQSSYDGYGNARKGRFYDADHGGCVGGPASLDGKPECTQKNGDPVQKPGQANVAGDTEAFWKCPQRRRPADTTTVKTQRYRFRYDGRWLMSDVRISKNDDWTYGPDLVDRWKARAFAQDPGSETPCCGYEEEDTNWGGSGTLLGERVGPVRAIRESWGADSGTNVIRRETFYGRQMAQKTWLRVHVIPPLDGIYAQWDFNAGRMTRYYSSRTEATAPAGVPIDGRNDEQFGNFDDPCNSKFDANDTSAIDQGYRTLYKELTVCDTPKEIYDDCPGGSCHQSIDLSDPSLSDANAALGWNVTAGPWGSIVDRIRIDQATDETPGGAAQSLVAEPYYRDDSCFDDGTGTDPGPKVHLRSGDEPSTAADGTPRTCWKTSDGLPEGSDHYYQGSIGPHGLHLLFLADSDNARQTVPLTEIVSSWQMVMLPGQRNASVGEEYGRSFEKPLATAVVPYSGTADSKSQRKRATRRR
jgi:hypothetical protein